MPLDITCHFRVQHVGEKLRSKIDHRHRNPAVLQVFRHLKANKAAAYHDSPFHIFLFQICPHTDGVIRGTHGEYARQLYPFYRRHRRGSARGNHQRIIVIDFIFPGLQIFCRHRFSFTVQRDGFPERIYGHTGQRCIFFRGVNNEVAPLFDNAAHIIGQPAAGIGDICALGDQCHLCASILPLQLGCRFGSGGHPSQYQYLHALHSTFSLCL